MTAVETRRPAPAATGRNAYWRLFDVELRRYAARAAVRWLALGMLAVVAVTAFAAYRATVPPTQEQLDRAQAAYQEQLGYWEESGEQQVADCRAQEAAERERNPDQQIDFGCDRMEPRLEWYLPGSTTFAESGSMWLTQVSTFLLMLALVVGATFVAAELSTGSISTWLTFEPRRGRVLASKVVVAAVATGLVVLVVAAAAVLAAWGAAAVNDAVGEMTPGLWRDDAGWALRTGAAGALAALLGAALGFLLRHTAAAIAVVFGWFVAAEWILGGIVGMTRRWSLTLNLDAWLDNGAAYTVSQNCRTEAGGYACDMVDIHVSLWQGGAMALGYAALVTLAAWLVFRRRDVA